MTEKRVLLVSPYFPPSTLAGVHRARLLARHLPAHGWEPVILCVDERHHEEPLDPGLAELVPRTVRVLKAGASPLRLSRAVGIGDLSLRGWWNLRATMNRFLRAEGADVVLITMGPFYTALLARGVRRQFRVPVVLDYQDPWVSQWGATLPRWSKGGWSHWLAGRLEPLALRQADWLTAVSAGTYEQIVARHPWIDVSRCTEAPIGGDPADFEAASSLGAQSTVEIDRGPVQTVSYVGTLWPRAHQTLRAVMRSISLLRERAPGIAARARFRFVGTSNQPQGGLPQALPVAEEEGVSDLVEEEPCRIPYLDALRVLRESHALLALGSDEPHYTASKIVNLLSSGRPVLATFHSSSSACEVIRSAGGALLVTYDEISPVLEKVEQLAASLERLLSDPRSVPAASRLALAPYFAESIAGVFAGVLDEVATNGARGLGR